MSDLTPQAEAVRLEALTAAVGVASILTTTRQVADQLPNPQVLGPIVVAVVEVVGTIVDSAYEAGVISDTDMAELQPFRLEVERLARDWATNPPTTEEPEGTVNTDAETDSWGCG